MSLLQRARSNDQEAWNQIVHLYGPLVQKWCRQASLQDDDLADVFQETFRAVSTHLKSFKPMRDVGSFRSWLRTIVRTKIADHFRRLSNQPAGQGGD
ncbi:MAG: sigma-70 family RNA polymerase sigma factor [Planctomycetota bacterium]|nr:sigma-70 family RNA polymerase sigma factor [Planctomycetota bacterium]MDA1251547.1 sigma-70 family RNA polymerase sigma factor [Planctomycetota bacterium]